MKLITMAVTTEYESSDYSETDSDVDVPMTYVMWRGNRFGFELTPRMRRKIERLDNITDATAYLIEAVERQCTTREERELQAEDACNGAEALYVLAPHLFRVLENLD